MSTLTPNAIENRWDSSEGPVFAECTKHGPTFGVLCRQINCYILKIKDWFITIRLKTRSKKPETWNDGLWKTRPETRGKSTRSDPNLQPEKKFALKLKKKSWLSIASESFFAEPSNFGYLFYKCKGFFSSCVVFAKCWLLRIREKWRCFLCNLILLKIVTGYHPKLLAKRRQNEVKVFLKHIYVHFIIFSAMRAKRAKNIFGSLWIFAPKLKS